MPSAVVSVTAVAGGDSALLSAPTTSHRDPAQRETPHVRYPSVTRCFMRMFKAPARLSFVPQCIDTRLVIRYLAVLQLVYGVTTLGFLCYLVSVTLEWLFYILPCFLIPVLFVTTGLWGMAATQHAFKTVAVTPKLLGNSCSLCIVKLLGLCVSIALHFLLLLVCKFIVMFHWNIQDYALVFVPMLWAFFLCYAGSDVWATYVLWSYFKCLALFAEGKLHGKRLKAVIGEQESLGRPGLPVSQSQSPMPSRIPSGGSLAASGSSPSVTRLNRAMRSLHAAFGPHILNANLRLLRIQAVLDRWDRLFVFEAVTGADTVMELPYAGTTEHLWAVTCALSWRWAKPKPATFQEAAVSPMSEYQFWMLRNMLTAAAREGLQWVWIDWCCVPQYSYSPMLEIHRSRLYYGRARRMLVLPDFRPLTASPVQRIILHNAATHLVDRDGGSRAGGQDAIIAAALEQILASGMIACREYFGRVWTLAERIARSGRGEQLCQWLPLEVWLGMVIDALLCNKAADKVVQIYWQKMLPPKVVKQLQEAQYAVALAERAHYASEELDITIAFLCREAAHVWHKRHWEEVASRDWLRGYLQHEALNIYGASSREDAVWGIYGYFCWRGNVESGGEAECLLALSDLCRLAGVDVHTTWLHHQLQQPAPPTPHAQNLLCGEDKEETLEEEPKEEEEQEEPEKQEQKQEGIDEKTEGGNGVEGLGVNVGEKEDGDEGNIEEDDVLERGKAEDTEEKDGEEEEGEEEENGEERGEKRRWLALLQECQGVHGQ